MTPKPIIVTLKNEDTDETRTVEVTGTNHTQATAEQHVADQYGKNAAGRGAIEARRWKVVPKVETRPAIVEHLDNDDIK